MVKAPAGLLTLVTADKPIGPLSEAHAAALGAIRRGFHIFPCKPRSKQPKWNKWGERAIQSEDLAEQWWKQHANRDDNPAIGLRLSNLVVLDEDTPGEVERLFQVKGWELPNTLTVLTSRGRHYYFTNDHTQVAVRNSKALKPGFDIDVQGSTGQVLAPGAVHASGAIYQVEVEAPVAELPRPLRDLLLASRASESNASSSGQPLGEVGQGTALVRELAGVLEAPDGTRNGQLNKASFALGQIVAGGGLSETIVRGALEEAGRLAGLDSEEIVRTVESGLDSGASEPRDIDQPEAAFDREVEQELRRLQIRKEAQRRLTEGALQVEAEAGMFVQGGDFMFDIPDGTPAVWGDGGQVLWAEGECLMLVGPTGVGKTTLAGQVIRARLGLGDGGVLGLSVVPTRSKVLYLAMDRPKQIARSLRRHFDRSEQATLNNRLVIRKGPPPKDVAQYPETLLELAVEAGADTVVIDSVKDAAVGLSKDEVGAGYNRARQMLLARGIEVLELHHQKKAHSDGSKPNDLNGVYGSAWITGGAGSVVLLWGEAGDLDVELIHLKQPSTPVGPWKLHHDHANGITSRVEGTDPLSLLRSAGADGVIAAEMAELMGLDPASGKDKDRARRALDRLLNDVDGVTKSVEVRGKQKAAVYRASGLASEQTVLEFKTGTY